VTATEAESIYSVRVSDVPMDDAWDAFLLAAPGGAHLQTTMWGRIKSCAGWDASRVIVTDPDGAICGGAQLLSRPLALRRRIGYVTKGPVVGRDDPALARLVLAQLKELAADRNVSHLTVQPPNDGPDFASPLAASGFAMTEFEVAPTASVQIDLTSTEDEILSRMKKNHRRYIRHGLRQGMEGRRGTREDLEIFYRLLTATAERQGFTPFPFTYLEKMWDVLYPGGHVEVFVVDYQGTPVSSQVAIGFGDTVITKNSGWSGEYSSLAPNHVLEWTTMMWAKSAGYRIYDLEGVDVDAARIIVSGGDLSPELRRRPFFWKLGFGGQVVVFPSPQVHITNPILRTLHGLLPLASRLPLTGRMIERIRNG